jgi:hypothetical protein
VPCDMDIRIMSLPNSPQPIWPLVFSATATSFKRLHTRAIDGRHAGRRNPHLFLSRPVADSNNSALGVPEEAA